MAAVGKDAVKRVSTHSRLKAAGRIIRGAILFALVSTHSRLKAAGARLHGIGFKGIVSTHSRLKAAGDLIGITMINLKFQHTAA